MKQAAAILSAIILITFFLPWFHIDLSTTFMNYGQINPGQVSTTASLAQITSTELTGGYLSFLWIIPLFALCGLVYSIVDRKNGYTWFTLYPSTLALFISVLFLVTSNSSSENSLLIGVYLMLFSALALWVVSIINNVKNYKKHKKACLFHIIISICIFIGSILMTIKSAYSVSDNNINASLYTSMASSLLFCFAIGLFLSLIIILILAKTIYRSINKDLDKNEENEEDRECEDTKESVVNIEESVDIPSDGESNIVIEKKYLYWVAGIIALLLTGWLIYSKMDVKGSSTEDYKAIFYEKYNEYPEKSMVLDDNRLVFIKNTELMSHSNISIYIMENKKRNSKTLQTIEFEEYASVDTVWLENIDGKEYLYWECVVGGGSVGNHLTNFYLHELNRNESYMLSYEFNPEESRAISEFNRSKSLDGKPQLLEFLKEKMRASEYYKMDGFFIFIDEFCSDREFQLSRIKFPVSYKQQEVTNESDIDENTYFDDMDNIYYKEVPVDKSEWRILGKDAFTTFHDSDKNYFATWEKVSPYEITFTSGWIDSEYDVGAVFKKINGKWYLTRFSGGN